MKSNICNSHQKEEEEGGEEEMEEGMSQLRVMSQHEAILFIDTT